MQNKAPCFGDASLSAGRHSVLPLPFHLLCNMTERARTIDETYRACNPDQPLQPDDDRYVDLTESRGTRQIAKSIARNIARSEHNAQIKLLFTGHRGSGKTTELLRLQKELEENSFFTIYMDTEELLDLVSLSYLDVLVAIAKQVQANLDASGMPLAEDLLNSIASWFAECIVEETQDAEMQGCVDTEAKAGSRIPFFAELFARVTASFKAGSSRRETIRQNLGREISVFMDRLNLLISTARETVRQKGFADLVLIVDGMEKMHYDLSKEGVSTHSELFIRHAEQLRSPQCHIIYTVPVSLAYNQNLGADFDAVYVLPMVKNDAQGISKLIEIVQQRVETELVFSAPELVECLARASGGAVRDLMRLVRMATETDSERIAAADVEYAVSTLRKEYDRLIRHEDIASLRRIQKDRRSQGGDEDAARLLNLRIVLEYQNGDRWADIHPVVRQIPWVQEALAEEPQHEAQPADDPA